MSNWKEEPWSEKPTARNAPNDPHYRDMTTSTPMSAADYARARICVNACAGLRVEYDCPVCEGTGHLDGAGKDFLNPQAHPACKGTGKLSAVLGLIDILQTSELWMDAYLTGKHWDVGAKNLREDLRAALERIEP